MEMSKSIFKRSTFLYLFPSTAPTKVSGWSHFGGQRLTLVSIKYLHQGRPTAAVMHLLGMILPVRVTKSRPLGLSTAFPTLFRYSHSLPADLVKSERKPQMEGGVQATTF